MPTPANSINEATTGICGFTGTAFTGTPVTAHDVLIGGATSSTIAQAAPSATSGVPLISQGAAADPAFGTAVVAGGGTGVTSFTAYAPVCGGTTTTNPLQSADTNLSTSGFVLTSNGSAALPSFQAIPSSFAPNATVQIFDDFIGGMKGASVNDFTSSLSWNVSATTGVIDWNGNPSADSGHPGIIGCRSFTVNGPWLLLNVYPDSGTTATSNNIALGGGAITLNWIFKINTLSNSTNRYNLMIGTGDTTLNADQANGCYVKYSDNLNSGNWQFITANGGVRTTSNSSIAVTAAWHNLQISINAAGTSVSYLMDGVSLGTAITTNIPSGITPLTQIVFSAGTIAVNTYVIDLFYMTQTLTSAR